MLRPKTCCHFSKVLRQVEANWYTVETGYYTRVFSPWKEQIYPLMLHIYEWYLPDCGLEAIEEQIEKNDNNKRIFREQIENYGIIHHSTDSDISN